MTLYFNTEFNPSWLKVNRLNRGLTISQLSDKTNIPYTTLQCYESGARHPKLSNIERLQSFFNDKSFVGQSLEQSQDAYQRGYNDANLNWTDATTFKTPEEYRLYNDGNFTALEAVKHELVAMQLITPDYPIAYTDALEMLLTAIQDLQSSEE